MEVRLKTVARELGFALVGIAQASEADHFERFREWVDRGYAGEMAYLSKTPETRQHPESILADVRSVVMVGLTYANSEPPPQAMGKVAKYARGPDYHEVIWEKLNLLRDWLQREVPGSSGRGVVDTAPLLERDFARRAGLGWFGKNTLLLNKTHGSFFFLGALLTSVDLVADAPHVASHCGTCTACLKACPTQAFPSAGWLDSRRCISYLTIELKSSIPEEFRDALDAWLFGCDICQDVCPWNAPTESAGLPTRSDLLALDPIALLEMSPEEYRKKFKGTALWRATGGRLRRNACLVLGNRGNAEAIPVLQRAQQDETAIVREAATWALAKLLKNQK